jgi:hypothetical protein
MDLILLEKIKELRCENNGITKIARLLNKSTDTIRKYLVYLGELSEIPKNVGGRKRKYNVDDNFFEKIDNEYNAYILGFIYADGCILERNQFSITVKRDDEYILEKINICMKSNFPIVRYSSKYDENHKATDKSSLRITSKKIIEDLYKLGCTKRKSDTLTFPKIDKVYIRDFMRGYFDGDGTVFLVQEDDIRFGIISTKEFCDSFLKLLPYNGKTEIHKEYRCEKNVYYISLGGKYVIKKIYDFLYDNSNIYLTRKYDIFENYYKNCKFYVGKLCPNCGETGGYKHGKYKNKQKLTCKYCNNHFYDEII